MGCYNWYSERGAGRGRSPPRPLLAVPNVTAHPSTASVPITVLLYNGPLLCGFNMPIKGYYRNVCISADIIGNTFCSYHIALVFWQTQLHSQQISKYFIPPQAVRGGNYCVYSLWPVLTSAFFIRFAEILNGFDEIWGK